MKALPPAPSQLKLLPRERIAPFRSRADKPGGVRTTNPTGAAALQRYLLEPRTQARIRTIRYPGRNVVTWVPPDVTIGRRCCPAASREARAAAL
jgi:hypothetical protein